LRRKLAKRLRAKRQRIRPPSYQQWLRSGACGVTIDSMMRAAAGVLELPEPWEQEYIARAVHSGDAEMIAPTFEKPRAGGLRSSNTGEGKPP
jgi:hypothetical protein